MDDVVPTNELRSGPPYMPNRCDSSEPDKLHDRETMEKVMDATFCDCEFPDFIVDRGEPYICKKCNKVKF